MCLASHNSGRRSAEGSERSSRGPSCSNFRKWKVPESYSVVLKRELDYTLQSDLDQIFARNTKDIKVYLCLNQSVIL